MQTAWAHLEQQNLRRIYTQESANGVDCQFQPLLKVVCSVDSEPTARPSRRRWSTTRSYRRLQDVSCAWGEQNQDRGWRYNPNATSGMRNVGGGAERTWNGGPVLGVDDCHTLVAQMQLGDMRMHHRPLLRPTPGTGRHVGCLGKFRKTKVQFLGISGNHVGLYSNV